MGQYLDKGNNSFRSAVKMDYVDKTGLLFFVNSRIDTKKKLICFTRPRRFGKTYSAQMLCAYYDNSCRSEGLFNGLCIHDDPNFKDYLNKYDVIYIDVSLFVSRVKNINGNIKNIVSNIQSEVISEVLGKYPQTEKKETLYDTLYSAVKFTENKFIIIIDEWDALFREAKDDIDLQEEYIQLLRGLFKSSLTDDIIACAYMTGILPIKKYGTQSALTDFKEYTMLRPTPLEEYVGFTEQDVRELCKDSKIKFEDIQKWYDGYVLGDGIHIYSPRSVMEAIEYGRLDSYWTQTETYESLKFYIEMDFNGLREDITQMLSGQSCPINIGSFQNDMTNIKRKDDVLTLLVHLGYLSYNSNTQTVSIPNEEIKREFVMTLEEGKYSEIIRVIRNSEQLLKDTLSMNSEAVAQAIEEAHDSGTTPLFYNNEQALRSVVRLAYICCEDGYVRFEEFPSGKGYVDIAFIPINKPHKPIIIIELKWNKAAASTIEQIKQRNYPTIFKKYENDILLVGITYDEKTKKHSCVIEMHNSK